MAGSMAKIGTSLAMLKVGKRPRVDRICLPNLHDVQQLGGLESRSTVLAASLAA